MSRVLIVPHPSILAGMTFGFGAASLEAAAASEPRRNLLRRQRFALTRFAAAISHVSGGEAAGILAEPHGDGPSVLEAIGAFVAGEESIDRRALVSSGEALVFDNVEVPLIEPAGFAEEVAESRPQHLDQIDVQAARQQGLDGSSVLVGVLDTGIDGAHPEFAGRRIEFAEFDENGAVISRSARDAGSHGTHVCGLLAGRTSGVAPAADLAVAAVLTRRTPLGMVGSLIQIASGLNWLLLNEFRGPGGEPGVDVVNASLGSVPYRPYLYGPLTTARTVVATLAVAAIGNLGRRGVGGHHSPGNYDIVVGVGAVDSQDRVADFSDWGPVPQHGNRAKPDLVAPGVGLVSAVPGGGFAADSGTSMATPLVSGAAALLLQKDSTLGLDAGRLERAILAATKPLSDPRAGRGRLDLGRI